MLVHLIKLRWAFAKMTMISAKTGLHGVNAKRTLSLCTTAVDTLVECARQQKGLKEVSPGKFLSWEASVGIALNRGNLLFLD